MNKDNNIENLEENKSQRKEENINNNSPSSINSKNKEKFNENENEEESKENKEKINQIEINEKEKELDDIKEKKYKNFQFLLSIIFMNQAIKKEEFERIILEENSDINEDDYLLNLSKNILYLIDDKNENDIQILQKIFKYQLKNNY